LPTDAKSTTEHYHKPSKLLAIFIHHDYNSIHLTLRTLQNKLAELSKIGDVAVTRQKEFSGREEAVSSLKREVHLLALSQASPLALCAALKCIFATEGRYPSITAKPADATHTITLTNPLTVLRLASGSSWRPRRTRSTLTSRRRSVKRSRRPAKLPTSGSPTRFTSSRAAPRTRTPP
jgi:hypothetical protein